MKFSSCDQIHYTILAIAGEIDLLEAPQLRVLLESAAHANCPVLILDLSEVSFVDSSGLSELIRHQHAASEQGRSFFIAGARPEILELLAITGLERFFQLHGSLEEACAAVSV